MGAASYNNIFINITSNMKHLFFVNLFSNDKIHFSGICASNASYTYILMILQEAQFKTLCRYIAIIYENTEYVCW